MTDRELLTKALEILEQLHGGCTDFDDGTVEAITVWCPEIIESIRAALAEPEQIPPEAQIEAEKVAYCAGWWAAMQKAREVNKPVAYRFQSAVGGWAYGSEPPIGSKYPVYPLYAAPQTEVKHAVPILQKQATKTHGNPTVPAEMWVYAEYLKANPEQAKEFFQRTGILGADGNLTEQYRASND